MKGVKGLVEKVVKVVMFILICLLGFAVGTIGNDYVWSRNDDYPNVQITDVKAEIIDIIEESKLYTAEYRHSGVVEMKDKKDNKQYAISYKGRIKAYVSFEDVTKNVSFIPEEKKIIIKMPEVIVEDPEIIEGSLKYLFYKSKYDLPSAKKIKDNFDLCKKDIIKELDNNKMKNNAKENAQAAIKRLLAVYDGEYEIVFK